MVFLFQKKSGNKYITIKKRDGVKKYWTKVWTFIEFKLTVNTKIKPGNYNIKVKMTVPPKDKENYNSHKEIKTLKLRIRE